VLEMVPQPPPRQETWVDLTWQDFEIGVEYFDLASQQVVASNVVQYQSIWFVEFSLLRTPRPDAEGKASGC
jgi:hypothetical protein